MKKMRKRQHMRALALMLAVIVAVTTAPASVEAKSVKPKLNKTRLKIVKGKTAKLKVRNVRSKNIRKTVWTVNKSGKKVVAFTQKSKNSITLKGKKKGTAKITAKISVGRKVYKRTAKVTVKLPASDKKDSDDEEEDEVEIEEDKGDNTPSSTKTPNQMPNTPEPVKTEPEATKPAAPVATEDMPVLSDTSKPVIPLRELTFVNAPGKLSCGDPEAETEGSSATVQVAYDPANATQRDLVWKSSDETLATVDANGLVTANSKGKTGRVTITAISKENATISASVIIEIYSLQPVSKDYSVLDSPDTKLLPKGEITGAGQTPVSDVDTFKLENGQLKGTFNDRNVCIVLDLGREIDVSKYGGVEIEGICPGSLALEFYSSSFDMYQTKDNGYEMNWWETTIGKSYPFYVGSCPWRYEGGGMNYLKQASNGYRGPDYPDDPQSVLPAEESVCYSLEKLTDSSSSGAWDKVRYIVIKTNQNPLLSSQYTFDRKTEVEYTITDLEFLAEEVVDDMDEGHFIVYNSEAEEAQLNVASSENKVTSYYVDKISKDKPADKRDTTMNLSQMKYVKVKVKDTDTVKLSLVKDGDTVEDAVVVGEEAGSGDRSVYFSLDDVDEDDLENVDQICVETAAGGKVTWVSATGGEISYKLDGSEKKIEVKDGKVTEVTLNEYGTEDPDWTPGAIATAKPSVAPTEPTKMPNTPQPSNIPGTAAPYVLTISEEMEADGTKNKEDYRRDVDWSEPGQVTFTNVNAYNGGLMLKLQENGEPMDMSGYKYIEADVETWADGGDEVFLKSFTDSSSIWSNIDGGKYEGETKTGRRTVRFDITDYKKALKSIAAIMISPKGDGSSDVQTSLTLYNVRFVSEGWEDEPEESPTT